MTAADGDRPAEAPPTLTLSAALKLAGFAPTGGQAKRRIQEGAVRVNGAVETRRKRRLRAGDEIEVDGEVFVLELEEESAEGAPDGGATDVEPGGSDTPEDEDAPTG